MPIQNNLKIITLTAGGGTESLPVLAIDSLYVITGTATLTSSWTIQSSGTAVAGMEYNIKYEADIILNGSTITFFGETMPEILVDKTCEITAYYDGTDWGVTFTENVSTSLERTDLTITGDLTIPDDGLIGATNTVGNIWVGDGTNFNSVPLSGDITIDAAGVATLAASAIPTPSIIRPIAISSNLVDGDFAVVTTGASVITTVLPKAADNTDGIINVKKDDAGAGSVIVSTIDAALINGNPTLSITTQHVSYTFQSDGSNWHIK